MHTLEIYNKETHCYPECVEELTPKQAEAFFSAALLFSTNKINGQEFKCRLLISFLDIKYTWKVEALSKEKQESIYENIARLAETIDSFFELKEVDGQKVKVLKLDFIKNLLPEINPVSISKNYPVSVPRLCSLHTSLIGPNDALTNVTFAEYRDLVYHYREFVKNNDITSLYKAIAVIYRPRIRFLNIRKKLSGWNGDFRTPYNPNHVNIIADNIISKLPAHIIYGIRLWINNCIIFFQTGKPEINGTVVDFSKMYRSGDEKKDGLGLAGIMFSIAKTGVFGDTDKVDKKNIYDIYSFMYQSYIDNEELQKQLKQNSDDSN